MPIGPPSRHRSLARLRTGLKPRLGIDRRALAAFRIGVGLLLLADLLVYRLPDLQTFYTDSGVLPRSVLEAEFPMFATWSLHALSGALWYQGLLVAIAAGVALAVVVGYRTRLALALSVVLLASLQARNPLVLNGGDTILLSVCLVGLFVPLGSRWSIDAYRRSATAVDRNLDGTTGLDTAADRVLSIGTATLVLHIALIYAMNAVLKFQSEAWMNGTAVPQIFQLDRFLWFLGPVLADATSVLVAVNWLWIGTLSAAVLLPITTGRLRIALVAVFVGAQLGMALTMRLGVFPLVMVAGLALFVPTAVWDRVDTRLPTAAIDRRLGSWFADDPDARIADGPGSRLADEGATERSPVVPRSAISALSGVVLVSFLVAMVGWHAITIGVVDAPDTEFDANPDEFSWSFFAPNPPATADWIVVAAEHDDGERTDAISGGAVTTDRPPDVRETYPTVLWKRYGSELTSASTVQYESLAGYFCDRTPDASSVTVLAVDQPIEPTGLTGEPTATERATVTC